MIWMAEKCIAIVIGVIIYILFSEFRHRRKMKKMRELAIKSGNKYMEAFYNAQMNRDPDAMIHALSQNYTFCKHADSNCLHYKWCDDCKYAFSEGKDEEDEVS